MDFDSYQFTLSKEEVEKKITHILQKDKEVSDYYQITPTCLKIYASLEDKNLDKTEFVLNFGMKKKPENFFPLFDNPHRPLKGLRVAIDPGHFGEKYSRIEEKYIDLNPIEKYGIYDSIQFDEGTLSVLTAKKLAEKLETLGATVLLTRSKPGETVYKISYEDWLNQNFSASVEKMIALQTDPSLKEEEKNWWLKEASPTEIFRSTYVYVDLERRAELINAFKPHITISCHYNLAGIYDKDGKTPGSEEDFTLFFVPGAFKKGKLKDEAFRNSSMKSQRSRYEFVRLLVTDDIKQSIELSLIAQKHCQKKLKLPPGDHCSYLKNLCLQSSSGIYHRNLTLPRLVHSPFLYAEPLCQDNFSNAKSLSQNPNIIIDKVVGIYAKSILEWAEKKAGYR